MDSPPAPELVEFANRLADRSREILDAAASRARAVEMKPDASPVTETDRLVERTLREMIAQRYPGHGVLGEEHGAVNETAEWVWVIDPIDGTLAFVAGVPVYGTLIGLAHDGRAHLGVIDHPVTRERWVGGAGYGSSLNGRPIRTRAGVGLAGAFLTCSNPDFMSVAQLAAFHRVRDRASLTLYGASCYAYGLLASGRTDLGVDCGLDIFDVLAPAAVIEGAGGIVSDWNGDPIDLAWRGAFVACGDAAVHREVISVLGDAP